MDGLQEQIELVATDLVLVSSDDVPALAAIHDKFQGIAQTINDEGSRLYQAARCCANLVEKLILNDVEGRSAFLSILSNSVMAMQEVIRDKRDFSEVHFPEELWSGVMQEHASTKDESPLARNAEESGEIKSEEAESFIIDVQNSDSSLLGEFITEAREHCATAEQMLMDIETGQDPESAINAIFRSFHTIKGAAGFLDLKPILVLAHESETLLDLARKGDISIEGRRADMVFDSIDRLRELLKETENSLNERKTIDVTGSVISILHRLKETIAGKDSLEDSAIDITNPKRLGELLVDEGVLEIGALEDLLAQQMQTDPKEKLGTLLTKTQTAPAKKVAQALRHQKDQAREMTAGGMVREVVKVDTERLDRLIDTIGELVIAESMVGQDDHILALDLPHISRNISHLNKVTRELQEMGMAMRLVPMRATFQKLKRAVRDLAKKADKNLKLVVSGEDTEVDRGIAEQISDPLVHMVRNSVDHGIETPEERIKKGKPVEGEIRISAYHKGGNIYFDIEDDGRGLDKERILAKAREKDLIDTNKEMTDRDIYNLIFLPGFSTASQVTDISGRGVGMDVVKRNIESMRGCWDIESNPGKGTKFSLRLPLTLAVIDGMLVDVENEKFIIPTLSVVESLQLSPDLIYTIKNRAEMINLRGELLPLIRINRLFGLSNGKKDCNEGTVVVVQDLNKKIGLVIDRLLGQRQTVIKSLGSLFSRQKWVSGGAILSNGNIGLILDVSGIIALAGSEESEGYFNLKAGIENDISREKGRIHSEVTS